MSEKLKPCPFCGGEAGYGYDSSMIYVDCGDCFATTGMYMSQDIAAKKWNTRHAEEKLLAFVKQCASFHDTQDAFDSCAVHDIAVNAKALLDEINA